MTVPVDPLQTRGAWLVTTASGARHLIDTTDPDAPTVTRVVIGEAAGSGGVALGKLRRDGEPVRLLGVQHMAAGVAVDGIFVGAEAILTLEPLSAAASVTLRRTTPVRSIEQLA